VKTSGFFKWGEGVGKKVAEEPEFEVYIIGEIGGA
jgi:hypothetical protein